MIAAVYIVQPHWVECWAESIKKKKGVCGGGEKTDNGELEDTGNWHSYFERKTKLVTVMDQNSTFVP